MSNSGRTRVRRLVEYVEYGLDYLWTGFRVTLPNDQYVGKLPLPADEEAGEAGQAETRPGLTCKACTRPDSPRLFTLVSRLPVLASPSN